MADAAVALIDARVPAGAEIDAATWIAGLPLVCRQVRQLARQGYAGATVVVGENRAAIEAALARRPPPPAFAVRVTTEDDPAATVRLDGRAVYAIADLGAARSGAAPTPLCAVHTAADARQADRLLFASLRKTVEGDGVIAYYFQRKISRIFTRLLINTRVTPNQVTLIAMGWGLVAAAFASVGGYVAGLIAGFCFWNNLTFDCVDGEMARLRLEGSHLGEWLDTLADDISTFGLCCGIGVGLWREGRGDLWLALGVGGLLAGAVTSAYVYRGLVKLKLPIDTAQFPWFFGKSYGAPKPARRTWVGWVVYVIGFLFRRDAFVTMISILLVVGLRPIALLILAGGSAFFFGVLLIHIPVTALRKT
jgi:phosphatidylglycerophosphate synthase